MSKPLFTFHRGIKPRSMAMPVHAHDEAQLTFAASGMVQVHTGEGRWLVPPQLAAWVPAGVSHWVEALTDAELWMVHWRPARQNLVQLEFQRIAADRLDHQRGRADFKVAHTRSGHHHSLAG